MKDEHKHPIPTSSFRSQKKVAARNLIAAPEVVTFGGGLVSSKVHRREARGRVGGTSNQPLPEAPSTRKRLQKAGELKTKFKEPNAEAEEKMKVEEDVCMSSPSSSGDDEDDQGLDYNQYYPTELPWNDEAAVDDASVLVLQERADLEGLEADGSSTVHELDFLSDPVENGKLCLWQLPNALPFPKGVGILEHKTDQVHQIIDPEPATFSDIPPGALLGKLQVYENGAVKLKMGDLYFDVSPGIPKQIRHEIAAVSTQNEQFIVMGEVMRSLVITPDIDSMLSSGQGQHPPTSSGGRHGEAHGSSVNRKTRGGKLRTRGAVIRDSEHDVAMDID